ncbi:helix-turn-helix domain-containing protein, partial [Streptomyces sp. NPDC004126]|uniref:helix-turn-helix domain-containing protein n=1 Tax=Streptomyces sp. NPDC004126 TaxID=3390695 RepID=UPI003CFCF4FB
MDIGELIRELRTAQGWSQGRLADEINTVHGTTLTREYIARWERGKVVPGGFSFAALSGVLDVPSAVLEDPLMRRTFLTDVAGAAIALLDDVPWEVRLELARRMRVESLLYREGARVALRRTVADHYLDEELREEEGVDGLRGGAPMGLVKLMGRVGVRRRCRRGASRRARRL